MTIREQSRGSPKGRRAIFLANERFAEIEDSRLLQRAALFDSRRTFC